MIRKNNQSRRAETSTLKEVMDEMLKAYRLEGKIKEKELSGDWEKIMGKGIANRTSEVKIYSKKLFLTLTSAPLRKELQLSKQRMIDHVNQYFKTELIDDIVFL